MKVTQYCPGKVALAVNVRADQVDRKDGRADALTGEADLVLLHGPAQEIIG